MGGNGRMGMVGMGMGEMGMDGRSGGMGMSGRGGGMGRDGRGDGIGRNGMGRDGWGEGMGEVYRDSFRKAHGMYSPPRPEQRWSAGRWGRQAGEWGATLVSPESDLMI